MPLPNEDNSSKVLKVADLVDNKGLSNVNRKTRHV